MRRTLSLCTFFIATITFSNAQNEMAKPRFAGLHFDFHAGAHDTSIGKTFTFGMIDSLLTLTKPDFIQVDCKGHAGFSSYPTKVGNHPAGFDKDILKIWREVTNKHKVPLYVHYSGVWDSRAIELHPEWARINADSTRDKNAVSLMSGYTGQLLEPQLRELAAEYKLDGAWIDGDCWVLGNDYSPAVMAAFSSESGIKDVPRKKTDPHFFEWMEFNRALFRKYITNYVNAAHQASPNFKITSNWSFSSMMPEKVDVPVDFLSGDVAGTNSLYSSAFESRCLALQGKPWDLMGWSFAWKNNLKATKSVVQMQQEAAEVLAVGGGFQTYWQQNRDGSPEPYHFKKMADVVRFTRERKSFCFESESIPQIGLLYSTYAWKRIPSSGLYTAHNQEAIKGNLNMLLDSQLPVDILMDHQLEGRLENYPVIVLPEWVNIDPVIYGQLIDYVQKGGNLVVVGAQAVADFEIPLGISLVNKVQKDTAFFAGYGQELISLKTDFQPVRLLRETKPVGMQYRADDLRFPGQYPLGSIRSLGKGKIAGIYLNGGNFYVRSKSSLLPNLIKSVVENLDPRLMSKVTGSHHLHQALARKNGKTYFHLINTSGAHDNPSVMVYEDVPELTGVHLSMRMPKMPKSVKLQPENTRIPFTYKNGVVEISLPPVKVYAIVEFD
jgi:hypothetical protein